MDALIDAIGSDSARLTMELQKLALHAESTGSDRISAAAVQSLIDGLSTNALQVGDALLAGAIALLDALIEGANQQWHRRHPLWADSRLARCCWSSKENGMWP